MRRRDFIAAIGGAAVPWPLAVRAQQRTPMRRIGVLAGEFDQAGPGRAYIAAIREGLAKLGWVEGSNLRIDVRLGADAAELVSLDPEAIVTIGATQARAAQKQTRTTPIVIAVAGDVLANGIIKNIARPEGNTTGNTNLYDSIGGKWVELIKEAAPRVERIAIIYKLDSERSTWLGPIEEAGQISAVKIFKIPYRDTIDIVHGVDGFAAEPNGGLVLPPPPPAAPDLQAILRLAEYHRLPTVSFDRVIVEEGGLMSYGSNVMDLMRRSAYFVDRILRGAKPGDLPVEFPTRFELVVSLKTAKAIGLTIPETFLVRADQIIE